MLKCTLSYQNTPGILWEIDINLQLRIAFLFILYLLINWVYINVGVEINFKFL